MSKESDIYDLQDNIKVSLGINLLLSLFVVIFLDVGVGFTFIFSAMLVITVFGLRGVYRLDVWYLRIFSVLLLTWVLVLSIIFISYIFTDYFDDLAIHRCAFNDFRLYYCQDDTECISTCNLQKENQNDECFVRCKDSVTEHLLIEITGIAVLLVSGYLWLAHTVKSLASDVETHLPYYNHVFQGSALDHVTALHEQVSKHDDLDGKLNKTVSFSSKAFSFSSKFKSA